MPRFTPTPCHRASPIHRQQFARQLALTLHALRRDLRGLCSANDGCFAGGYSALVASTEARLGRAELLMELLGFCSMRERRAGDAVLLAALHRLAPAVEDGMVAQARSAVLTLAAMLAPRRCRRALRLCPQRRLQARPAAHRCMAAPAGWPFTGWQASRAGLPNIER